jgi:TP901 family phage tail tape measure protein
LALKDEASKAIEKAGNGLKGLSSTLTSVGQKMTMGITAPLVGMGVAMMKTFADFENVMVEIEARTGATAEEMKKMNALAIEMGRVTKFSATEAAQALLELTSSGQSAAQAMATLPHVLNLAAAGNIELGRAADGVTDILAQYQLGVKAAASVTDILTKAAGASSATVESMIDAFSNVGPVAKAFGMSIADTAAALAVLHENGIKGAEAGTALKSMLTNMSRNTEAASQAWRDLGLSMYNADGSMKNIDDLFKEINKAMEDMTMKEQNQITQDLAGSYGMLAFNSLRVANGTSEMRNQMNAAAGAEEVAAAMSKTLTGRWDALMSSVETLSIVLGQMAAGPLGDFLGWLTDCINAFSSWAETNPAMAQTLMIILGIVAAVGPLLVVVGSLLGAFLQIQAFMIAFPAVAAVFSGAWALILGPIGLLIGAVLLLVAIWNNWFGIRDILVAVFTPMIQAVQNFVWTVINLIPKLIGAFGMILEGWRKIFTQFGVSASQLGTIIWEGIKNGFSQAGTSISQLGTIIFERLKTLGSQMFILGEAIINGLINGIKSKAVELVAYVFGLSKELTAAIKRALGISSPSKVMMKLGENVVQGFHKGISDMGGVGVTTPGTSAASGGMPVAGLPAMAGAGGNTYNTNYFQLAPGTSEQQAREIGKILGKDAKKRRPSMGVK